jgi:hypothetical protein
MCGFDVDTKLLETILQCECGGNVFHLIRIEDVDELECAGCKKRMGMDRV